MYKKEFEIRWSDVDANAHLANSAYTNFMSHTRMGFFNDFGFGMKEMHNYQIGPIVFYEHMYYYKEAFLETPITVTLEILGLSEDGMFFLFEHNFYDDKGKNLANCEILGAWIDTEKRKLTKLPDPLLKLSASFPRATSFKTLTKEDTRKFGKRPLDLKF